MIAAILAAAAVTSTPPASVDGLPVGGLARQTLPATGCAAYLFSTGETRVLIGAAAAQARTLRLSIDGAVHDYPLAERDGAELLGLTPTGIYRGGDVAATLSMRIEPRANIDKGAIVADATLTIERTGRDTVILPVAGMIGCA